MQQQGLGLMTTNELLEELQISRTTLYRWLNWKLIPQGKKIGGRRRWFIADVKQAIEQLQDAGHLDVKEVK